MGEQPSAMEAALRERRVQRTAQGRPKAQAQAQAQPAQVEAGPSSRGVRFQDTGVQTNPLFRARRTEGERRASRRVPSVETWLIMEYCNSGTLRVSAWVTAATAAGFEATMSRSRASGPFPPILLAL